MIFISNFVKKRGCKRFFLAVIFVTKLKKITQSSKTNAYFVIFEVIWIIAISKIMSFMYSGVPLRRVKSIPG